MNQNSSFASPAIAGAVLMIVAAIAFAGTNVLQSVLPTPAEYGGYGMASTGMAFWQYVIASIVALPLILRIGFDKLRTRHPVAHEVRAFVSALGVHVFVYGFSAGVPIWQMVTLLATGQLFIVLGAALFLKEPPTAERLLAALLGFAGALIVSGIGTESFSLMTLVPIAAAALWAATDVLTRWLSREETPETLTLSLLVLITPNHLAILLLVTALSSFAPALLPAGVATGFPFQLPDGMGLWLLLVLGVLTGIAQYLLAAAYKVADATYLQPFGDLKVPLTALIGWVLLGQTPTVAFWLGAALIISASAIIYLAERNRRQSGGMLAA
jgi:drug/metabolite transporter (DMT)-like permease